MIKMNIRRLILLSTLSLALACDSTKPAVNFFDIDSIPGRLSKWRLFEVEGKLLVRNDGVIPYDLNTPLFSDYALKLRTVWMPDGTSAKYRSDVEFDFPIGTIISKTFHYELASGNSAGKVRVIKADRETTLNAEGALDLEKYFLTETRLLVRYEEDGKHFPMSGIANRLKLFSSLLASC